MIFSTLLISSLFLVASFSLPVGSASPNLKQLTPSDFKSLTKNGVWFIEFFSPYCGHCKKFAPTWAELVQHVEAQENPGITLAQVNCIANNDLCNDEKVGGYPTLRIYKDGQPDEEFKESREFDRLTTFIAKHAHATPAYVPNPNGQVLALTPANFNAVINQGPAFVKFYAPWCGHCKRLAPTWVKFAEKMKGTLTIAEVNCEDHKGLCALNGVQGYPAINFFQHGRTLEYSGSRTLDKMVAFAEAAIAPPLASISASDLKAAVEEQDVVYAVVHDGLEDITRDTIEEASQPLHGTPKIFSVKANDELLRSFELTSASLPAIVSLKDHSMSPFNKLFLSDASQKEAISDWLQSNSFPSSIQLGGENFAQIMGPSPVPAGTPRRLVVLTALRLHDLETMERVKSVATRWHREHAHNKPVVFAYMDTDKWADWLKSVYGIKRADGPTVIIVDHGVLQYYDTTAEGLPISMDVESVKAVLRDIQAGNVKPKYSENIAERFARRVNGWMQGVYDFVVAHPILSIFIAIGIIAAFVMWLQRILEEDSRKLNASVYVNGKSGGRLD